MAKDKRRSNEVKEEENNKLKKKMVRQDASSSSSRRSSRETSSSKQTKEILTKENVSNTRKSVRLEKKKPSGTPESKEKLKGTQEQIVISPVKKLDGRKKVVEKPASSNTKSKKKKAGKSLKQCMVDTSGDKRYGKRILKAGNNKRKRGVPTGLGKGLSKRHRIRTEAGDDDNDKESEEKSSESNFSSKDTEQEKLESSKSMEDKDDSDDECSDMKEDESTVKASRKQRRPSHSCLRRSNVEVIIVKEEEKSDVEIEVIDVKEESIESGNEPPVSSKSSLSERKTDPGDCTDIKDLCDTSSSKDRRTCKVAGLTEMVEKKNGVLGTGTSICIVCKLGRNLRSCEAVGCNRCYHLSCLDPLENNVKNYCPFCEINTKSSVHVVPGIPESIWDTREVEVLDAEGLQKQKQYFVKYKGLAHILNKWVTETQLLHEAPLLVENYSKNSSMKWSEEWTVPHQLLKKRLFLSLKPLYESQQNSSKVLNYQYEFLVQWQGLDYEQATWELENTSVLDSPKGHNLIKEFEKTSASSDDKIEDMPVKLPTVPAGCAPGMDNIHLSYVKNLHDAWNKGQNSIVFDGQDRTMRIVLFILSLKGVPAFPTNHNI